MSQSWPLKRVGLRVRNLETTLAYYQQLGFAIVRDVRAEGIVGLGAGEVELLTLRHTPDARPRADHTAGLYHFAILLPSEADLGTFLQHSMQGNGPHIDRMEDHLVSQSLYFYDPEGNGIEIYIDRPRDQWLYKDGRPLMDLQLMTADAQEALLAKAQKFRGLPEGTILGHKHLNVSDLQESLAYYQQMFGMELMGDLSQLGIVFVSWDGYHHHIALNNWTGPHAAHHEPEVSGLDFFELTRPGLRPGTYLDPSGVRVVVTES